MRRLRTTLILLAASLACGLLLWVLRLPPSLQRPGSSPGRTGRLFRSDMDGIGFLLVERNGLRLELQRQPTGWQVRQPFTAPADPIAVQRILDALEAAPCLEIIPVRDQARRELTPAHFGLVVPRARIVLGSSARRAELLIGANTPVTNQIFVCFSTSADVLVTSDAVLACLPAALEHLRDQALVRANAQRVTGLSLRRPGQPFARLHHARDGWYLLQPLAAKADDAAVSALIEALCTARITRFLWPSENTNGVPGDTPGGLRGQLAAVGLDDASESVRVEIRQASDPVGATLVFGAPVVDLPGHTHVLAPDGQTIVAVTNRVLQAALTPLADLRDRRLFAAASGDVSAIGVHRRDQTLGLRRNTGGRWELTDPVMAPADQPTVARLIDTLLRLRADTILDTPPASLGPTASNTLCTIDLQIGSVAWRLLVAEPDPATDGANLAFTNSPTVFIVPRAHLPAALWAPLDLGILRDKTILNVAPETIRRLALRRIGGVTEVVYRDGPAKPWRAIGGGEPDRETAEAWVRVLSNLRAERVAALEIPDPAACGLTAPDLEITLDLAATDAVRKVLTIGAAVEGGGRYAALRGHDVLFVLAPETVQLLERALLRPAPVVPAVAVPAVP